MPDSVTCTFALLPEFVRVAGVHNFYHIFLLIVNNKLLFFGILIILQTVCLLFLGLQSQLLLFGKLFRYYALGYFSLNLIGCHYDIILPTCF